MSDTTELLNLDTFNDLRTMLEEGLDELLREYLQDSVRSVEDLKQAASAGDLAALTSLAHSLKGSSGNLGIQGVYRISERIELAARADELADPVSAVDELEQVFQRTRQLLDSQVQ